MAAWSGFTDEDLRKVKNISTSGSRPSMNRHVESTSSLKKGSLGSKPSDARRTQPATTPNTMKIDSSMKLVPPGTNEASQNFSSHKIPKEVPVRRVTPDTSENVISSSSGNGDPGVKELEPPDELNQEEALSRDIMSMDKFREQQRAMEEANKQKKALLSKTLSERRKKAQAEAHKLEHIQRELARLDHLLTADVQVVRHKIEDASLDFLHAQKRYEKAETEYVEAKVDLHVKQELKEQLAEHLYTIIHQNEVRKAKKLANLMLELDMESNEEELQLPELPPLTSFQPTIAVQTSPTKAVPDKHTVLDQNAENFGKQEVNVNDSGKQEVTVKDSGSETTGEVVIPGKSGDTTTVKDRVTGGDGDSKLNTCDNTISSGVKPDDAADTRLPLSPDGSDIVHKDVTDSKSSTDKQKSQQTSVIESSYDDKHISAQTTSSNPPPPTSPPITLPNEPGHIKVGQTSKMVSELRANVTRELEAVEQLEKNVLSSDPGENVVPTSWEFDGTIK